MSLKNYLLRRGDQGNDRYKMFIGANIIKELKDAGAVLALLSNKADGSGPLTGNNSPWSDLVNDNDGTLNNFAGTVASGWNTDNGESFLTFDGVDDFVQFADTASLDITSAPLAIGVTMKPKSKGGQNQYVIAKNGADTASMQYGILRGDSSEDLRLYLNGTSRKILSNVLNDLYLNAVFYWDGTNINAYKNKINDGSPQLYSATLSSAPNIQIGARSNSIDGLLKTLYLIGDISTLTIYTGSDIQKILDVEAKISAPYLALNP